MAAIDTRLAYAATIMRVNVTLKLWRGESRAGLSLTKNRRGSTGVSNPCSGEMNLKQNQLLRARPARARGEIAGVGLFAPARLAARRGTPWLGFAQVEGGQGCP